MSDPSLHRRGDASTVEEAAEQAMDTVKKNDWKRPVVISISAIGLAMTVGWNYIAAKSFFANRERYLNEQKRREAQKDKPPPRVGDTMCLVQTYTTDDQVQEKRPSEVQQPCFVLGQGQAGGVNGQAGGAARPEAMAPQGRVASPEAAPSSPRLTAMSSLGGGAAGAQGVQEAPSVNEASGGVRSQPPVVFPALQQTTPAVEATSSSTGESVSDNVEPDYFSPAVSAAGATPDGGYSVEGGDRPLNKRGMQTEAVEEIVEDTASLHSPPPLSASSSSSSSAHDRTPLLNFDREARSRAIPALTPFTPYTSLARARPGFAAPRPLFYPLGALEVETPKSITAPLWAKLITPRAKLAKLGKIPTEDITFGLTVLNTIGGVPSLMFTLANAMYYRGNPRTD